MTTAPVIEVVGLRKEYRRLRGAPTRAVDGLDLTVEAGGVHGFLGPNGSGKTTTVRCLLGLVRPTAGQLRLLGHDCRSDLTKVINRVGSIVETPTLFPAFSGRRNLALLGRVVGVGPSRVDQVLDQVGLGTRADEQVSGYSLGMRQRLGLAAALLKDPELLILDEPGNGLDPAGIKEIRDLLRRLGDEGRTVFVSSHQLGEVQQICDTVSIVAKGKLVASGRVDDVLARGGSASGLVVRVEEPDEAVDLLCEAGLIARRGAGPHDVVVAVPAASTAAASDAETGSTVTRVLADNGLYLYELRREEADLESVFLDLTGDETS